MGAFSAHPPSAAMAWSAFGARLDVPADKALRAVGRHRATVAFGDRTQWSLAGRTA